MATILAAATGNWSATGTWTGGVVPTTGDIVVANGKTVTLDTLSITVAEVRNDTTGGAVAGGGFNMVSGGSLTANVYAGSTSTSCVTWAGTTGQTATVTGNFFGGTSSGHAISFTGGNLTIGGGSQSMGGTGTGASCGINNSSSGTFAFATAGVPGLTTSGTSTSSGAHGIQCTAVNSTITIYASIISANSSGNANGLLLSGASQTVFIAAGAIQNSNANSVGLNINAAPTSFTCVVSGNIQGGSASNAHGVLLNTSATGTYTFTVAGNIAGGAGSGSRGISHDNNNGTLNITGNIIGPSVGTGSNTGVYSNSTGTINITGSATAGTANAAVQNGNIGTLRLTRAVGNGFGLGSAGISNVVALISTNSGSLTYVEQLQFGSLGNTPVSGPIRLTANTGNVCQMVTTTGSIKTLVDTAATAGVLPAATDVRTGVTYSSGNLTGTCAVPAAGSVALGVAVDATTGTAVLTAANVRTAVGLASANLDTQLAAAALPTAAQIRAEMDANSTKLANLDATVSSRLATSGYSTPPTAAAIRTEIDTNSTKLDATVSSRLATSGYTAPPSAASIATAVWAAATRTLTTAIDNSATIAAAVWSYATGRTITGGTVDTLTNAPSVPSASTIASAVRTELTTELGRIDASVSSRLAPSGTLARVTLADTTTTLTNSPDVPTEAEIAAQVRTELTAELARVSNAATTQQVAEIVEGALQTLET